MNEILMPNANLYASRRQIEIREQLGSGKDGLVLIAEREDRPAGVAIKVLRWAYRGHSNEWVFSTPRERVNTDLLDRGSYGGAEAGERAGSLSFADAFSRA